MKRRDFSKTPFLGAAVRLVTIEALAIGQSGA
jgi:hypothetical protein